MSEVGISWSPRHAESLGLDAIAGLKQALQWPIHWVRLGAYWDEIESKPGQYDFSSLDALLDVCAQHAPQVQILLTVGVKAPRWPEFYFPDHVSPDLHNPETQQQLFSFLEATIKHFQHSGVTCWQLENEPLDPSGPGNRVIPEPLLRAEVALVRSLDDRPVVITVWGNALLRRGHHRVAAEFGDAVGIDLYYRQHLFSLGSRSVYGGPADSASRLRTEFAKLPCPLWITELQAEPWEKDEAAYRGSQPGSFSVERLQSNWEQAQALSPEVTLFWGAEYWVWRAQQGDSAYVEWMHALRSEK